MPVRAGHSWRLNFMVHCLWIAVIVHVLPFEYFDFGMFYFKFNADSFTSRLHIDCKRAKLYTHIHITILFIDYQIISDLMSYTNHWPAAGSVQDNKICFVHEELTILVERQMSHLKLSMAWALIELQRK